jgi:hypothetical protein
LGEDKANLLGSLLLTKFQLAAMERANVPENERKDFYLFIDEFHNFSTDSFAGVLSEARKYRLCLTLSHQYMEQLPPEIRNAVFGNVGSIVSFRVGNTDAEVLANEFGNGYTLEHFTELSNHEVRVKILEQGAYGAPFSGWTASAAKRLAALPRKSHSAVAGAIRDKSLSGGKQNHSLAETLTL